MDLKKTSLLKARMEFLRASLGPGLRAVSSKQPLTAAIYEFSAGRMSLAEYESSLRFWGSAVAASSPCLKPLPAGLAGEPLVLAAADLAARAASLVTEWQFNQATFALEGFGAKKFLASKVAQPR